MKQPKKLTRLHKKLMSEYDLDFTAWAVVSETKSELTVIHKESKVIKILDK